MDVTRRDRGALHIHQLWVIGYGKCWVMGDALSPIVPFRYVATPFRTPRMTRQPPPKLDPINTNAPFGRVQKKV